MYAVMSVLTIYVVYWLLSEDGDVVAGCQELLFSVQQGGGLFFLFLSGCVAVTGVEVPRYAHVSWMHTRRKQKWARGQDGTLR